MKKKTNSTDVARLANVSRSTVSLVVNGVVDARIGPETRERVLGAARQLNYRPNAAGRSLVSGRTETIALVLRDTSLLDVDLFLQPLLHGILKQAQEAGYGLMVESPESPRHHGSFSRLFESGHIDGMIVENLDFYDEDLKALIYAGQPIVVLGSQGLEAEYAVQVDNARVGRMATEHLLSIGRRRIAHVTYSGPGIHATDCRLDGYRQALGTAGLNVEPERLAYADFSSQSAYQAMATMIARTGSNPPDGVFAGSDSVAFGVMAALQDSGFRVPEDVAVVGIDDINMATYVRPSLTTVRSYPFRAGNAATRMLVDLIEGREQEDRVHVIESDLVVRGSTISGYDRDRFGSQK